AGVGTERQRVPVERQLARVGKKAGIPQDRSVTKRVRLRERRIGRLLIAGLVGRAAVASVDGGVHTLRGGGRRHERQHARQGRAKQQHFAQPANFPPATRLSTISTRAAARSRFDQSALAWLQRVWVRSRTIVALMSASDFCAAGRTSMSRRR